KRRATAQGNASTDADPITNAADTGAPRLRRLTDPGPSPVPVPGAPRQTGPQVEGLLTFIDCSKGMTLRIQIGNGIVQLHSDNSSSVDFTSDVPSIKDSTGCGPLNPPAAVTVSYRRSADPAFLGEPIRVLFVDKNQR